MLAAVSLLIDLQGHCRFAVNVVTVRIIFLYDRYGRMFVCLENYNSLVIK